MTTALAVRTRLPFRFCVCLTQIHVACAFRRAGVRPNNAIAQGVAADVSASRRLALDGPGLRDTITLSASTRRLRTIAKVADFSC